MIRRAALLAALASIPGAASAQVTPNTDVSLTLAWQESDANGLPLPSPNGTLEPGEHALIRLSVAFTNQHTIGSFQPPVGTFTSGTLRGLGAVFIDLVGTNNAAGTWNLDHAVDPAWDLVGPGGWGTPANGGARLQNIQAGQFPLTPQAILTTNPIPGIWHGIWTPADFTSRIVTFASDPGPASGFAASVVLETSPTSLAGAFVSANHVGFGSVQIPIAPAPATLLFTILALAFRRRRKGALP